MTTRLEVESAIKQWPQSEIRDIANWLQNYLDETWDREMEEDLAAGKLDRLVAKEWELNKTRICPHPNPLPEEREQESGSPSP